MFSAKTKNKVTGDIGETLACNYLVKKKYKILERNYRSVIGEIDIIAKYKKTIVFIEVKRRLSEKFGRPSEAVNAVKQFKIRSVASGYLKHKNLLDKSCRFDVVEILDDKINHIENAF